MFHPVFSATKHGAMKILILEPFYTGSHQKWIESYVRYSQHDVTTLTLPGRAWKWRMQHGAVTLAREFMAKDLKADLLLASDMLDLASFLALTRQKTAGTPTAIYFHENQLSYPWSEKERNITTQKAFLGAIHLQSALAADALFFNSAYNRDSFLNELQAMLNFFPDDHDRESVALLRNKSSILRLGVDLQSLDGGDPGTNQRPLILWNHRWEYDKNPAAFFVALRTLKQRGHDFGLAILGEQPDVVPDVFISAQEEFRDHIEQWGYVPSKADYVQWLRRADLLPVTSNQEFFGESVAEAIYCGCQPLLPKRLAYPELIPAEFHDNVFYTSQTELIDRLERALNSVGQNKTEQLSQAMLQYDWSRLAPQYDAEMERISA